MAKKKPGDGWKLFLIIAGAVAALGVLYLATGAGSKKNSPYIPDPIEDELDKLADALTKKFGEDWIKHAEDALLTAVPLPLRPFVAVLRDAKMASAVSASDWPTIRAHAAKLYKDLGSAA